jgi:uncharacterized membrane protein
MKNLAIGSILILFGVLIILYFRKKKPSSMWSVDFKGYALGVMFIIIGIAYICNKG